MNRHRDSNNPDHLGNMGVVGYDDYGRGARGNLIVYGSRIMEQGYPYGTFSTRTGQVTSGYNISSNFDSRFMEAPPPFSPTIGHELKFKGWRYARD